MNRKSTSCHTPETENVEYHRNCSRGLSYHCIQSNGGAIIEVCAQTKRITKGFCALYNNTSGDVVRAGCNEERGTCPYQDYWSNNVANFTACLEQKGDDFGFLPGEKMSKSEPDFLTIVVPTAIVIFAVFILIICLWYWCCHRRKHAPRDSRRHGNTDHHVHIGELYPMISQTTRTEGAHTIEQGTPPIVEHQFTSTDDTYDLPDTDRPGVRYENEVVGLLHENHNVHDIDNPYDSLTTSDGKDVSFLQTHYPFVETAGLRRAVDILHCHRVVVLVGFTGSGKTYNGMMILDRYKKNPDDDTDIRTSLLHWNTVKQIRSKEHMYVLFDDCFGRFCGVEPKLEENIGMLDVILSDINMKDSPFYVIITVPLTIWSKHTELFKRLSGKLVINLSLDRYSLSADERKGILLRHLENNDRHQEMEDPFVDDVIEDNNKDNLVGFPVLCYIFSEEKSLFPDRYTFFKNPRYTFSVFLRTFPDKNVYLTMVYALFQGGRIEKCHKNVDLIREIASIFRMPTFCSSAIDHVMTYINRIYLNGHEEDSFFEFQHDFIAECAYISLDSQEIDHLKAFSNQNDILDELSESYCKLKCAMH